MEFQKYCIKHKRWVYPIFFILILAPFTPWIDLTLEDFFYAHGNDPATHFMTSPLIRFMYDKAALIPLTLAFLCLPLLFFKKWVKPAQVVLLTLIIGTGLITESFLKEYWGRPRPKQIERYGGRQAYRPFWSPNFFHQTEPSKSFVSSHAATGFLFLAGLVLADRFRLRRAKLALIVLTLFFGVGLSLTRMAQGGHFFSDCLFAALIMWFSALSMNWLVFVDEDPN